MSAAASWSAAPLKRHQNPISRYGRQTPAGLCNSGRMARHAGGRHHRNAPAPAFRESFLVAFAGLPDILGESTYRYWRRRMNTTPRVEHPMSWSARVMDDGRRDLQRTEG